MIFIAIGDYYAYSHLQSQTRQLIKKLDHEILLINTTKPLSPEDQNLIKKRMKLAQIDEFLKEFFNQLIDRMPFPSELAETVKGGEIC